MKTGFKLVASSLIGLLLLGVTVFWPAGTFNYWQAWVFIAVFTAATVLPTIYLGRSDPAVLRRRMHGGPTAEGRPIQKVIIVGAFLCLFGMVVVSALDHRFGWSSVPAAVSLLGDFLVAAGIGIAMLVIVQNGYAAATVTVEADQKLTSTGLYKFVRHPMYVGNVVMMLGIPLALGSYWGLVFLISGVLALVLRIRDEEQLLIHELGGYREYRQDVRYRLVPYVW
jgi:protein-S-isoprenylcysteine O-methyltransferase Ste14